MAPLTQISSQKPFPHRTSTLRGRPSRQGCGEQASLSGRPQHAGSSGEQREGPGLTGSAPLEGWGAAEGAPAYVPPDPTAPAASDCSSLGPRVPSGHVSEPIATRWTPVMPNA